MLYVCLLLTHISQLDLPTLNGRTSPFPILGMLGGIYHFFPNFNRTFGKKTVQNLIRCHILSVCLPSDSTCFLKAEPGELYINRPEPGIQILQFTHCFTLQTSDYGVIYDFLLIQCHRRRHSKSASPS